MPRMSKQRKQEWSLFLNERNSPADYSAVDAAIAKANGLNRDDYKDFSAVEAAINLVVPGKKLAEQADVDAMAQAIEDAIAALQYKDADYTKVDAAIAKASLELCMRPAIRTRTSPQSRLRVAFSPHSLSRS